MLWHFSHLFQAKEIMSNYQTGVLENSAKMVLLFHLIDESVGRRDKILVFRYDLLIPPIKSVTFDSC